MGNRTSNQNNTGYMRPQTQTERYTTLSALTLTSRVSASILVILTIIFIWLSINRSDQTQNEIDDLQDKINRGCDSNDVTTFFAVGSTDGASTIAYVDDTSLYQSRAVVPTSDSPNTPVWASAEQQLWVTDTVNSRITIIDTLSRRWIALIETANFDCLNPASPAYSEKARQVWIACQGSSRFLVFDSTTRDIIASPIVPPGIIANATAVIVGKSNAVAIFAPENYGVYNTDSPGVLTMQYSIPGTSGIETVWHNEGDSSWYAFTTSPTPRINKLEWGNTWALQSNTATGAVTDVPDMTSQSSNKKYLYVVDSPASIKVFKTSDLPGGAIQTVAVAQNSLTSIGMSVDNKALLVGSDRGIALKYDVKGSNGLLVVPDTTPSYTKVSPGYEPVGGISPANLGCPCHLC